MTAADRVLILAAIALIGILYVALWHAPQPAAWVEVRRGGEPLGRYALNENRRLEIDGRIGKSLLEIRGGRVRFLSSPCRNQICVHGGWLSHSGDVAACLPNRISITLGGTEAVYDAVSF